MASKPPLIKILEEQHIIPPKGILKSSIAAENHKDAKEGNITSKAVVKL
jgi:hypothetical protein